MRSSTMSKLWFSKVTDTSVLFSYRWLLVQSRKLLPMFRLGHKYHWKIKIRVCLQIGIIVSVAMWLSHCTQGSWVDTDALHFCHSRLADGGNLLKRISARQDEYISTFRLSLAFHCHLAAAEWTDLYNWRGFAADWEHYVIRVHCRNNNHIAGTSFAPWILKQRILLINHRPEREKLCNTVKADLSFSSTQIMPCCQKYIFFWYIKRSVALT